MEIKDYSTKKERDRIVAEMEAGGYTLIEEQNHFDGNHLIFMKALADWQKEWDEADAVQGRVEILARMLDIQV